MTQRNNLQKEAVIPYSTWVKVKYDTPWPVLFKTTTIKKDLDKHMVEQGIMPTTDKSELNKMVKK